MSSYAWRRTTDLVVRLLCGGATIIALIPLGLVLYYVVAQGVGALSFDFLTELPQPVGESGGGMANAIVGTFTLLALAAGFGIPTGVLAGIYLAEYGGARVGRLVRFFVDVMAGVPSITIGLFVYSIVVVVAGSFSALAGGIALAVLMLPTVTRGTEELLRLVPNAYREAALGLGVAKWRAVVFVVLRTAAPGIATGVMLSIARAAGETAPLLFTSLNNQHWAGSVLEPTASLPVMIYTYAVSPYETMHRQAWTAALVLVLLVLGLDVGARLLLRYRVRPSR